MDFKKHNDEVTVTWQAYRSGNPTRVPMVLGISSRFYLLDEQFNTGYLDYESIFNNPRLMIETQCKIQDFIRHNIPHDIEMGIPSDGWSVAIDFQNVFDAAWFGAKIIFPQNQCPDTKPLYTDNKYELIEKGIPGPFDGIMAKVRQCHDAFYDLKNSFEYKGVGLKEISWTPGAFTDGPFTLLCQLRGAENTCVDMLVDVEYYHQAMEIITTAIINRIREWKKYLGSPEKEDGFAMADDFVQLISTNAYKEFVLPYHRRIYRAFSYSNNNFIHLCGDATRHFSTIVKELNVKKFDTGFPVDFTKIRCELGKDVEICGGPHVELLLNGSQNEVAARTSDILRSGIMKGGKFILREGNNLAPHTPLDNISTMYEVCKDIGKY